MTRKDLIVQLRDRRLTYEQIGRLLGISRQRVHQLLKGYASMDPDITHRIRLRDGNQCVLCEQTEALEVHHIDGDRKTTSLKTS